MRKVLLISYLLFISATMINAQRKHCCKIGGDSLLSMFKIMEPFDVLKKIDISKVDAYDCYYNKELKQYLLVWLDKKSYFDYLNRQSIHNLFTEDYKIYKVKGWLINHKEKNLIDTVLRNTNLFNQYLDSIVQEETKNYYESFFKNKGVLIKEALDFHARLKLPEAYSIVYRYWVEDSLRIDSDYFFVLLAMHDPKAIAEYNSYVDNAIKNKDLIALDGIKRKANYEFLYGSLSVDLKIKLLKVNEKIRHSFSDFPEGPFYCPFNIDFLNPLSDKCFILSNNETVKRIFNLIYNPIDKIYKLSYKELEHYSDEIIKNINEYEAAAQPYKDKIVKDEIYWKCKMTYQKSTR